MALPFCFRSFADMAISSFLLIAVSLWLRAGFWIITILLRRGIREEKRDSLSLRRVLFYGRPRVIVMIRNSLRFQSEYEDDEKKRFLWLSLSEGNLADYIWIRPKRGIIKSYISIITAVYVPHSLKGLDFSSFLFYSLQRKSITKQIFKNKILKVFYILKKKNSIEFIKLRRTLECVSLRHCHQHTHTPFWLPHLISFYVFSSSPFLFLFFFFFFLIGEETLVVKHVSI